VGALWVVGSAAVVVVTTSLDLAGSLVRGAGGATAERRRRILRGAGVVRVALVAVASVVSLAFVDLPVQAVGVLGLVPVAYGVMQLRRRRHAATPTAIVGWLSAGLVTLALSGDDVAAWIVLLRWQAGRWEWLVAVVLVAAAVALPLLVGSIVRNGPAERTARVLITSAAPAQIAVGTALVMISIVGGPLVV